jgi:hypothetical protein
MVSNRPGERRASSTSLPRFRHKKRVCIQSSVYSSIPWAFPHPPSLHYTCFAPYARWINSYRFITTIRGEKLSFLFGIINEQTRYVTGIKNTRPATSITTEGIEILGYETENVYAGQNIRPTKIKNLRIY